jgi:flagellar basal-body rod protein FlgF
MIFAEYLQRQADGRSLSYVHDFGTQRDVRQGAVSRTGNSLDVALQGDGYLAVHTPMGVRYPRNGRMSMDAQGQHVPSAGYAVLGEGNQPMTVPPEAKDVSIAKDGSITTNLGPAARMQVLKFAKDQELKPAAGGLYVTDAQPAPAEGTVVLQGMIEDSNVQPIVEITRMMSVSRAFEAAKDLVEGEGERQRNAIDKLGKVA